jgi:hypothetical protein
VIRGSAFRATGEIRPRQRQEHSAGWLAQINDGRKEGDDVLIDRRSILILLAAGLFGAGSIVTAQEAQAAPSGRVYVGCGTNYNHCVALRRAYVRDGNHIGPLHFGHPGCTAPPESGCATENWFYVYR